VSPELTDFAERARRGPGSSGLGVGVYARLLRGRLRSAVEELLPRTARLIGADRVTRVVEAQLTRGRARSPLFRSVVAELVEQVSLLAHEEPGWPAAAASLARYEWLRFSVAIAEREGSAPVPLDPAHGVAFARAVALLALPFRVHDDAAPGHTRLLLYRAPSGGVEVLVLGEPAYDLLHALRSGALLTEAITSTQLRHGREPALWGTCATLIADLVERGVLRGRRSVAP
jgi:hypothetical protein